ncbi:MAG: GntR family transcriptional regulator [Hyphomonadaceae bacterium]|nr:GntR family transcriptional regulator [Hyphomonadaceae bacterium]
MTAAAGSSDKALPSNIAASLRSLIIRGTLAPGEHLGQAELATRFNVSKVPIREALKQLATDGLLQHDHNRGYFVTRLSQEEAKQLYRLRRWIESELLASARWPNQREIAQLRRGFEEIDRLNRKGDRGGYLAALEALRLSIFELSEEKVLLREAARLWSLTDRYRAVMPNETMPSPERNLIDALERRDRSALLAAYHADRDQIESLLFSILQDSVDHPLVETG